MWNSTGSATTQLEQVLTIPPASLHPHQHNNAIAVAYAALEYLRDSGDDQMLFLRTILEQGTTFSADKEELFFHCITGCRQVFLWQWTKKYSLAFLRTVRDYFMVAGHALSKNGTTSTAGRIGISDSRTCRLALYTASAAFWKREWNNLSENEKKEAKSAPDTSLHSAEQTLVEQMKANLSSLPLLYTYKDLFHYLDALFDPAHNLLWQAAAFTHCLVSEFSGKSAVSYRLPLEFHKIAHRSFERESNALNRSLRWAMSALGHVVSSLITAVNSHQHQAQESNFLLLTAQAQEVVFLTMEVLGWEFGLLAWADTSLAAMTASRFIIRPPIEWGDCLGRTDLLPALYHVHNVVMHQASNTSWTNAAQQSCVELARNLRQLLLQLASLSGPIFLDTEIRKNYAKYHTEGALHLLERSTTVLAGGGGDPTATPAGGMLVDTLQLVSRLIANFRLASLVEFPSLLPLLQGVTACGSKTLTDQVQDCEQAEGDIESLEHGEWREEVLTLVLECCTLLCIDPYILYSGSEESRKQAQASLSGVLGPLYTQFIVCRTRMAGMEEHFLVRNDQETDDLKEEILENFLEEELTSVSTMGRLNLSAAIACLSAVFGQTMPELQSLWEAHANTVTPETAALLEKSRLLTMYICYLLTDRNKGESPCIPDAVIVACQENQALTSEVAAAVQAVFQFANAQATKISEAPTNRRLSPMLAKSFLWFFYRWAPAYVYPSDYGHSTSSNRIVQEWSTPDKSQEVVDFCISLCLCYQCYWPQEGQVQQSAAELLMALAKRGGKVRAAVAASPRFHQMVHFHILTAGVSHSVPPQDLEAIVRSKVTSSGLPSMSMVWGYQRLPYIDRARILTAILVACSDSSDEKSNVMISNSLNAIHETFLALVHGVTTKQFDPDDEQAKEMAYLSVEMFGGVALAGEMSEPERIPDFITPHLLHLSGLMSFYGKDMGICEALLRLFRDYTEQFVATLSNEQSLVLFKAAAELLKSYSAIHCESRVIEKKSSAEAEAEEEQAYADILCVIQLLINLGTKDFTNAFEKPGGGEVESSQVTDMVFFGLQQILPLMTKGLLQFPTLSSQFFELASFMMDTYPDKVCLLPYELFDALMQSLMFGMSHNDVNVAKCSLLGLASIVKEQIGSQSLNAHLLHHPDIFTKLSKRLLTEVIFQNTVLDRVEATGAALLPLAAVNINQFAAVVQELSSHVQDEQQRARLQAAFTKLIQPEIMAKVLETGYAGRINRMQFKEKFEEFVEEVHSFLVLK